MTFSERQVGDGASPSGQTLYLQLSCPPIKCQVRQRYFLTQMIMFIVENLKCKPNNKAGNDH